MIKKYGMHGLTDIIIATEREWQVTYPSAYMRSGKILLYPTGRFDKINSIIIMFLNSRSHSQHIGIEDDIIRIKADLLRQDTIGTRTNFNLPFKRISLSLFVESHHHRCSSQLLNQTGMFYKFLLSLFQWYGIDDRLTLQTLQSGFYHLPLRRINHHRNTCNIGFRHHQIQENSHLFLGIQQPVVHIDINDQSTVFHLLACDAQCLFVFLFVYQTKELTGTGHVAAFAYIDKIDFGCLLKQLQPREPHPFGFTDRNVRTCLLHQWDISGNIFFSRTAASADNIHQSLIYVFLHFRSHIPGSLVILPQTVGKSCIGIRTDIIRSTRSQPFQKRF